MRLLTASIVALALIVTAVGLSIGTHSPADGIRGTNPLPELDGLDFDIGKFANDAVWAQYVAKGDHLRCVMDATDAGAGFLIQDTRQPPSAASPWTGDLRQDLVKWGWHDSDYDKGWECDFERMRLSAAFNGLGLNAKSRYDDEGNPSDGDNDCFSITHYDKGDVKDPNAEWPDMRPVREQKYKVGEKEYTATGAYYEFAVNVKGGGIIGKNLLSPGVAVVDRDHWGRNANPGELPELRYASEIYWGYWVRDNPNVKNLRVYGAYNIVNDDTVLLVARALRNSNQEKLTPWPGAVFDAASDEGKALIGSPIGATIAHLLIGHKAELGIKRISKVIVVTNEAPARPKFGERPRNFLHVFFQIIDVPAQEMAFENPEGENPRDGKAERAGGIVHVRRDEEKGLHVHTFSYKARDSRS